MPDGIDIRSNNHTKKNIYFFTFLMLNFTKFSLLGMQLFEVWIIKNTCFLIFMTTLFVFFEISFYQM
ncbi:MAG: presenilin-like A22 family membrane protease [Paraglaciecola sp.]|jgi:presenilin-like A22 family membrane protease